MGMGFAEGGGLSFKGMSCLGSWDVYSRRLRGAEFCWPCPVVPVFFETFTHRLLHSRASGTDDVDGD